MSSIKRRTAGVAERLCFRGAGVLISFLIFSTSYFAAAESPASAPITIGAMAELTGQFAKVGEDCRRGYELAERFYGGDSHGSKARIVIVDNQGEAKAGLTEFQRLINVEHAAVVITSRSPVGLAINPVSKQKGLPIIGIVAHPAFTVENPFALRVFPSSAVEGVELAKQVAKQGKTRIATITLEDDYFLALTEGFKASLGEDKLVFSETILPTEMDYGSILLRLKAKRPDAILLNAGPKQLPGLLKWIRDQRLETEIYSNFLISSPDVIAAASGAASGATFVQSDFDKPNFRSKLRAAFGDERSSPIGYSCLIGLSAVLQVLARGPGDLSEQLLKLESVDVLGETIPFKNREAQIPMVVRRIHDNAVSAERDF